MKFFIFFYILIKVLSHKQHFYFAKTPQSLYCDMSFMEITKKQLKKRAKGDIIEKKDKIIIFILKQKELGK